MCRRSETPSFRVIRRARRAMVAACAALAVALGGWPLGQEARADELLEYLESRGLDSLAAMRIEDLAAAAQGDERAQLLDRLADLFARMLDEAGDPSTQARLLARADYRIAGTSGDPPRFELGRWRPAAEALAWGLVLFTFVLPMLAMALTSLVPAYGVKLTAANATLENYRFVMFDHGPTQRAFVNSFLLSAGAALALVALSLPLGWFMARRGGRLLGALAFAAELPYALPGVVLAIACILLFLKPLPLLGFGLYNTVWIILVAYLMRFLILVLRPVVGAYQQLDRSYEEAAQMAGARFAFRQRTIALPMVAPAAAAGALIVFLTAFNELTVSALLWSSGAETLGVAVFSLEQGGDSTYAAALAGLSVVVTVAIMAATSLAGRRMPKGVVPWRD